MSQVTNLQGDAPPVIGRFTSFVNVSVCSTHPGVLEMLQRDISYSILVANYIPMEVSEVMVVPQSLDGLLKSYEQMEDLGLPMVTPISDNLQNHYKSHYINYLSKP